MKRLFFTITLSIFFLSAFPAHIKGGFFSYEYLGPGINNPAYLRYKIILTVYMSCYPSSGQLNESVNFTIFQGATSTQVGDPVVQLTRRRELIKKSDDPCITENQAICYYTIVEYELNNYELAPSANGYTISYQRCCRIAGMENIVNSGDVGNTYSIRIPGTSSKVPDAVKNTSPSFPFNDTAVVCGGNYFSFPFTAVDKDGDVLTYTFCSAFEGGSAAVAAPDPSDPPPYGIVNYAGSYSGSQPMGSGVTINSVTGLISGIAPKVPLFSNGEFVVTVCVTETRNGVFLGESRKELHIQVKDCVPQKAQLAPKGVTCDGFSVNFSNMTDLNSNTIYTWTFGDTASGTDNASTLATPTHVYTDTGVYKVVLEVTTGGFCESKDSIFVKVYPGFFPAFSPAAPFCKGQPVRFGDNTTTSYGVPTGWKWDFGNPNVTNDTSALKNPTYSYANPGTYTVQLIVGNTFGCIDTVTSQVVIADNPLLTLQSKDTSYCGLDSLLLSASGTGNFSWTPAAATILNANTATPLVFPTAPTVYYVALNAAGCVSRDSVKVSPVNDLITSITASATNICEEDTLTLTAVSNYTNNLSWNWSPLNSVSTPDLQVTKAFPGNSVTYTLTTHLGKNCVATATRAITVKRLAIPRAGPDTYICIGQTTTQLSASGGNSYQWSPAAGLSDPNIANPVASPGITTNYRVLVGVTGCAKTRADTVQVLVRALPPLTVTNDTLICDIDTLQLSATGTGNFVWTPNVNISRLNVANPQVSPDEPVTYYTTLTDAFGCKSFDSVYVNVKSVVTINAGNDTTICRTDGIFINTTSDALHYNWTPALYLDKDTAKRPFATPLDPSITYTVVGNIGKCQSHDQVTIKTIPYPQVKVTPDTIVCFGDSAPLLASGGSIYSWTPAVFLTSAVIPNPIASKPTTDTKYTVSVRDVLGCPKAVTATVWVRVYPVIRANAGPPDTSIVIGQPLLFNATGGDNYVWTPPTWLSNPNINNPVGMPEDNILYKLVVSNSAGCKGTDSILVKVFKVPPSFYVPTGFSPNDDSKNDVIKPILLGMRSLKYFRVYNRWGQLLFATSQQNQGWDGTYKGNPQDPGTYVWMAEGETFTGQVIKKQGTVVLLR